MRADAERTPSAPAQPPRLRVTPCLHVTPAPESPGALHELRDLHALVHAPAPPRARRSPALRASAARQHRFSDSPRTPRGTPAQATSLPHFLPSIAVNSRRPSSHAAVTLAARHNERLDGRGGLQGQICEHVSQLRRNDALAKRNKERKGMRHAGDAGSGTRKESAMRGAGQAGYNVECGEKGTGGRDNVRGGRASAREGGDREGRKGKEGGSDEEADGMRTRTRRWHEADADADEQGKNGKIGEIGRGRGDGKSIDIDIPNTKIPAFAGITVFAHTGRDRALDAVQGKAQEDLDLGGNISEWAKGMKEGVWGGLSGRTAGIRRTVGAGRCTAYSLDAVRTTGRARPRCGSVKKGGYDGADKPARVMKDKNEGIE
ncbi:hypothetical protein B0H17DRAFT_1188875, partial [Mycena rosella]